MVLLAAALGLLLVPGSMSAANAVNASPLEVALAYLEKSAGTLGVGSADVEDMFVTSSYKSTHTGVTTSTSTSASRSWRCSAVTRPSTWRATARSSSPAAARSS